jgi:hypothetical protein
MQVIAHCIFCDDIRYELQSKVSIIGCYGSQLIVPQPFPFVMPKFCIMVEIRFPVERLSAAKLLVFQPDNDDPVYALDLPADPDGFDPTSVFPDYNKLRSTQDIQPCRVAQVPLTFAPFVFAKAGYLRVRLQYKEETFRVGAIEIVSSAAPTPTQVSSTA